MTREMSENLAYVSAIGMLVFGVILVTAGFIMPPPGEIHDSVLYVLGQCLFFSGSVMGVSVYTTGKIRHFEHTVKRDIDNRFRAYERGEHVQEEPEEEEENDETAS